MAYVRDLARWLREDGLIVEELAGWQDAGRGDELDAEVVVSHHTAGGPSGRAPSLGTVINGVPAVRGPLANIVQSREADGPDHFIIVAAGVTNNAGTGGWAGFTGNPSTIGLEIEHTGRELLPEDRSRLACRCQAAILRGLGLGADRHCQHWEWNGRGGKIDVAEAPGGGSVDGNLWRQWTAEYLAGGGGAPPSPPTILEEELELMSRHAHYTDAGGDLCILGPGDDGLLHFQRNRGGKWSDVAPVTFVGGTPVAVNPAGGVSLVRYGATVIQAIAEGKPNDDRTPTFVRVDVNNAPLGVPLAAPITATG